MKVNQQAPRSWRSLKEQAAPWQTVPKGEVVRQHKAKGRPPGDHQVLDNSLSSEPSEVKAQQNSRLQNARKIKFIW